MRGIYELRSTKSLAPLHPRPYNRGMNVRDLHSWDLAPKEAATLQEQLAPRIISTEAIGEFDYVAGVDVCSPVYAYGEGAAAVVVMTYPGLEMVEERAVRGRITFPYVPGLLSFRELPLVVRAFEELHIVPNFVLVDGQGVAHPRRCGIAAHLGLLLDIPTIGCAKSRLIGEYEEPAQEAGGYSALTDNGEVIGAAVRTRAGTRAVFVSVGNRVSQEQAVRLVISCCRGYRLPEPARMAHSAANAVPGVKEPTGRAAQRAVA